MPALDHALADRPPTLCLFGSMVRRYGGHGDPSPAVDALAMRDRRSLESADSPGKVVDRLCVWVEHLAVSVASPRRIALQTGNIRAEEGASGYGCLALTLFTSVFLDRSGSATICRLSGVFAALADGSLSSR